jgi:hypothetical protein
MQHGLADFLNNSPLYIDGYCDLHCKLFGTFCYFCLYVLNFNKLMIFLDGCWHK